METARKRRDAVRRVRERKRAGPERGRSRSKNERNGRKGNRAAKVSLILISISWCDVYLTTTAWSRERASVVFLSLHPRGAHRLEFLARCFIQGHRGPLPGQERAAALPSAV